jgi:catechol 2,3-dioxygenase-like lactoylglutathione lyase family enzyme
MFAVDRIDHVELFVRDMERSIRWYVEVLGLRELYRWEPAPVMIGAGGTMLALFPADETALPPRPADDASLLRPRVIAWRTDRSGFQAAQAHLKSLDIAFIGPVDHDISWSIYFDDPDGHALEITSYQ